MVAAMAQAHAEQPKGPVGPDGVGPVAPIEVPRPGMDQEELPEH